MTRVCLVAMGLPAFVAGRRHAGPGLRSAQFAVALARAGYQVTLFCVMPEGQPLPKDLDYAVPFVRERVHCRFVYEKQCRADGVGAQAASLEATALVGVTAYASSVALRLDLGVPMWADLFGDLMAEAQAKASACGDDSCLVHFWSLLSPVLTHADRFSAVSSAQADALVGQLGLCGRLSAATSGESMVAVLPCGAEVDAPRSEEDEGSADGREGSEEVGLRGRELPADAHILLWSGGFNTWCDIDTLTKGFACAAAADPRMHWVVTGGSIPGHEEASYRRFLHSKHLRNCADRVHCLGWVDSRLLATYYREADLGVVIERDLYERRFGSENRAVHWMAHGLPFVTTALSELGDLACENGAAFRVQPGSAKSLSQTLSYCFADEGRIRSAGVAARRLAEQRFDYSTTTAPLLEWVADPRRAGDFGRERVLRAGLLSEPETLADVLEAYLAGLGPAELGRRSSRWLWRRLRASLRDRIGLRNSETARTPDAGTPDAGAPDVRTPDATAPDA